MTFPTKQLANYSEEAEASEAFKIHQRLCEKRSQSNNTAFDEAADMYEIKTKELYKLLGYDKFESYIAQPEIDVSRAKAYQQVQVHEVFVVGLGMPVDSLKPAGIPKLATAAKYKDEDGFMQHLEEILDLATSCSRSDLRTELAEMFGEVEEKKEPIDWELIADELKVYIDSGDLEQKEYCINKYKAAKVQKYGEDFYG